MKKRQIQTFKRLTDYIFLQQGLLIPEGRKDPGGWKVRFVADGRLVLLCQTPTVPCYYSTVTTASMRLMCRRHFGSVPHQKGNEKTVGVGQQRRRCDVEHIVGRHLDHDSL